MVSLTLFRCGRWALFMGALTPALFGCPVAAWADESTAADTLFEEGKKLMAQRRFAEACLKFEESERLDPALGTVLNLADCNEKEGRTASAWAHFLEAVAMAQSSRHPDAERVAGDRAAALARRLSKIVIDVKASPTGLEIKRDGAVVQRAQWGTPIPADPGPTMVTASAPGRQTWETRIVVGSQGVTATVQIPELETVPAAPPTPAAITPLPTPVDRGKAAVQAGRGMRTTEKLALVSGGIGVMGIALGTIFGLQSKSRHDDAEAHCDGPVCRDAEGVTLKAEAKKAGNVATVAFALGALGLAGGAALWFLPDSSNAQVGVGFATVQVRGRF